MFHIPGTIGPVIDKGEREDGRNNDKDLEQTTRGLIRPQLLVDLM